MSDWRAERNDQARRRLQRALPAEFPREVLVHAEARPLMPPLPRLAVESYWRAHPIRADRLARALAARSGSPAGWEWRLHPDEKGRAGSFRVPPAPYREEAHLRGPGFCCVCGQPVYRFGWHIDLWSSKGPNTRAEWHACCVAAWKLWNAPQGHYTTLSRLQERRCAGNRKRLLRTAEVDHKVPLFRVWRDRRETAWPILLGYWGFPNLQALNLAAHRSKTIGETRERAAISARALDRAAVANGLTVV